MLEEEEVEVPVSATNEAQKDATKMDTDAAPNDTASGTDVNMQESKNAADTAEGAENGAPASEEKSVPMDTDTKVVYCLHLEKSFPLATILEHIQYQLVLCAALS
jgi:heat shock 70kDa protein 4